MNDKERSDADYDGSLPETYANEQPPISPEAEGTEQTDEVDTVLDDIPNATNERKRNTYAELRELQRLMMETARYDEMGSSRASAARVWRDLEILRLAKLGKPICLNTTGKLEPQRKAAQSPIVALAAPSQDQQAA
jgi:hypothetical protein